MDDFLVGKNIFKIFVSWKLEMKIASEDTKLIYYKHHYSAIYSREALGLGFISLVLTLINIICIVVTGWAILKLKEVTPDKIPQHLSSFWKKDLKVHREYLNTIKDGKTLVDEARLVLGTNKSGDNDALENTFIQTMFEKAHADEDMMNIRDWVAKTVPGAPKIKKVSTASMNYGSLEVGEIRNWKRTFSHNESIRIDSTNFESGMPDFRTRAMSSDTHGEMLRQKMHAQAKMIIWSRRISSMGSIGSSTDL